MLGAPALPAGCGDGEYLPDLFELLYRQGKGGVAFETSDPELYRRIHPSLPGSVSATVGTLGRVGARFSPVVASGLSLPERKWCRR